MVRGALSLCTAAIDGGLPGSNVESYNCVAPAVPPKHPSVHSMAPRGKDAGSTTFDHPGRRFGAAALEQHGWVQARGKGQEQAAAF